MLTCVLNVAKLTLGTEITECVRNFCLEHRTRLQIVPIATNDEPSEAQKVKVGERPTWLSWKDVPRDPRLVAKEGPWFLEVFSGTARLTAVLRSMGIPCLPPIDIMVSELVTEPADVVDAAFWDFIMQLILLGAIFFMHFGTPCNTFSSARKEDGGPPTA